MKALNIILVLLTIFILGCKKEDKKIVLTTNYVNSDLVDEYFFIDGSYWIYENQSSQIDSITVESTANDFNLIPCPHACPNRKQSQDEYFSMELKNQTQNKMYNYYLLHGHMKKNGGGSYCELGQPIFIYNTNVGYEFNCVTVTEKYDSLFVLYTFYYNVTKMSLMAEEQYQQEFEYNTDLYFSPNIGLVKIVTHDTINGTETWNLKRYQIEQ